MDRIIGRAMHGDALELIGGDHDETTASGELDDDALPRVDDAFRDFEEARFDVGCRQCLGHRMLLTVGDRSRGR